MSKNGFFSRLRRLETQQETADFSPECSEEVHVLAVDDSLVDRKVIERLLKITSCKVTAVDSGRRALEFLGLDEEEENSPGFDGLKVDLVITDYCMPGMTGYDLLKKIKGSSSLREIPVVIMSSENVLARIDRCLEEGAEEFLVKPVKLADVERLKNYMFGGNGRVQSQDSGGVNKRKLQETTSDVSVSPSLSPSPPSSPSPDHVSLSPDHASSTSTPSPSPTSSPNSPISFSSMPCSPTSRDTWFNNETNELKKTIF